MSDLPDKSVELLDKSVEQEQRYHHYTGNAIPWYVRLLWVLFWCFIVYYAVTYFLPNMQTEVLSPP